MFNSKRIEALEERFERYVKKYPPVSKYRMWDNVRLVNRFWDRDIVEGIITKIEFNTKTLSFDYDVVDKSNQSTTVNGDMYFEHNSSLQKGKK